MYLALMLVYNLDTGKRKHRGVAIWETPTGGAIESELTKRLLLPTRLPQEWLPVELRTGASGPVRSWIDQPLDGLVIDDVPEGLPGS